MPRVNFNEINEYSNNSNGEWFSLKKDKEIANVHILANDMDDVDFMVVHKVQINGVERYVNCLRKAGDPIDDCPLCASGNKATLRMFLQLYDVNDKKLKIWDRGKNFANILEAQARRVKPLYGTQFEIERCGAPGSAQTTYNLFPIQNPDVVVDTLPEKIELLGENSIVLDKSFEDMRTFVSNGAFDGQPQIQRRQSARDDAQYEQRPQPSYGSQRASYGEAHPQDKTTMGRRVY